MSPVFWMLSSSLGICVGVVPAGSSEGETPRCHALYVVLAQRTQTREEKGAGNASPGLERRARGHRGSHGVSHHFCLPPGADAAALAGSFPALGSSVLVSLVEGDPAGAERTP